MYVGMYGICDFLKGNGFYMKAVMLCWLSKHKISYRRVGPAYDFISKNSSLLPSHQTCVECNIIQPRPETICMQYASAQVHEQYYGKVYGVNNL